MVISSPKLATMILKNDTQICSNMMLPTASYMLYYVCSQPHTPMLPTASGMLPTASGCSQPHLDAPDRIRKMIKNATKMPPTASDMLPTASGCPLPHLDAIMVCSQPHLICSFMYAPNPQPMCHFRYVSMAYYR